MTADWMTPQERERAQLVLLDRWLLKRCPPEGTKRRPDMAAVRQRWSKAARDAGEAGRPILKAEV
jgi:hypothetical protein